MSTRVLEVIVHRERGEYWTEIPELPGLFATGDTFDELLDTLREGVALCLGDDEPLRLVTRVTGLRLEIETDVRPDAIDSATNPPPRRQRHSHLGDDWPPERPAR